VAPAAKDARILCSISDPSDLVQMEPYSPQQGPIILRHTSPLPVRERSFRVSCVGQVFINDLLSSGEIPELFAPEDRDEIVNALRPETKSAGLLDTTENCWSMFIQKVRARIRP
jgi:hypothetical protein